MMSRIIFALALFAACPLPGFTQTSQPDMTVFGYKLGEKLIASECPCKVIETAEGYGLNTKHYKTYIYEHLYNENGKSDCFERMDLDKYKVRKKDQLDSLPVFTNGMIKVLFDPAHIPRICPLGSFNATLVDSKLMSASFSIKTADADEVFATLKKKYGPNPAVKNYQLQNGYGATLNYYLAVWSFPNLRVTMLSSEHHSISDLFGIVLIEIPQKTEEPKEKRAL